MNYRHAYHAGNFADVMKHALLTALIQRLKSKDKPFCVIDTHAGDGLYALDGRETQTRKEYEDGILRVLDSPAPALKPYLELVRQHRLFPGSHSLGHYPGSPWIARGLLRPQDKLMVCDIHPDCISQLKQLFHGDDQVAVHALDGYQACKALLPPTPRRGLLLMDPPFEQVDEFGAMLRGLKEAERRWNTGIFALWYPIKQRTPVRAFHRALQEAGFDDVLAAELFIKPLDNFSLSGCGLVIINAPWQFDQEAQAVLDACVKALRGHEALVEWLARSEAE